jgi:hypothetical protein
MEEEKKITVEDLAWQMYQSGSLIRWETTPTTREEFPTHSNYDMYMKAVKLHLAKGWIPQFKQSKVPKTEYPVIKVPANGKTEWHEGARTMCFVYSKHHGNFILEGYIGEVQEYLKKNYTKYFCYFSLWSGGISRGFWRFWKDRDVSIIEPSKFRKQWKYKIISREPRYSYRQDLKTKYEIHLKRLPKKWIPEFDKL